MTFGVTGLQELILIGQAKVGYTANSLRDFPKVHYLTQQFLHGVVLSQQVVDLIMAVHRRLALTGAAEILGHLTRIVLILLKLSTLGKLCDPKATFQRKTQLVTVEKDKRLAQRQKDSRSV